jgi:hypothetical protein
LRLPEGASFSPSYAIKDPAIDRTDTHVSANVTLDYSTTVITAESMCDPVTNTHTTSLPLEPAPENVHIGAGYNVDDQALVNTYGLTAQPNPETELATEACTIKAEGAAHSICDEYGNLLPVTVPDGAPANSPMEGLAYEGAQVTDGVLLDATTDETVRSYNLEANFSIAGQPGTATRVARDRLRITTTLAELAAGGASGVPMSLSLSQSAANPNESGTMTRTYGKRDNKFVLEEVLVESEIKDPKATIKSKERVTFKNVKGYENKHKDKERKEKREKAQKTAALAPPAKPSLVQSCIIDEFGSPCDGSGGMAAVTPAAGATPIRAQAYRVGRTSCCCTAS